MTRKRYHIAVDKESCKGCELCMAVCPKHVFIMDAAMNSRGQHYACPVAQSECVGCLQCADICPDAAIGIDEELT
jgi:2-oxoglutarate ferredoxin oxidoreductase subunit delta